MPGLLRSLKQQVFASCEGVAHQGVAPRMVQSGHPMELSSLRDAVSPVGWSSLARDVVSHRLQEADARMLTRLTPAPPPPWARQYGRSMPRRPWEAEDIWVLADMPPAPAPLQSELEKPMHLFLRTVNVALVRNGLFLHVSFKDAMTLKGLLRQITELWRNKMEYKFHLPIAKRQIFEEVLESDYMGAVADILNPKNAEEKMLVRVLLTNVLQRTVVMQNLSSTSHNFRGDVFKTLRTNRAYDKGVAPACATTS